MASTTFQDYNQNTPIVASWLNDVNDMTYSPAGVAKNATLTAAAWVRFSVSGGVVTIQQSNYVLSVVRNSVGVFTITYQAALTNAANCYEISSNLAGFTAYSAETAQSVTVVVTNPLNAPTDPGSCCVVVYGGN